MQQGEVRMHRAPGLRLPLLVSPVRLWLAVASATLLLFGSAVNADDTDALLAAVRQAVAAGQTQTSPVKGFHDPKRAFTELPRAAILIGFDCGIRKFID